MKALGLWTDLAILGLVLVVFGGPPCETWSALKRNQFVDSCGIAIKGPRPVRSLVHMCGLPCLSRAKRKQDDIIQFFSAAAASTLPEPW